MSHTLHKFTSYSSLKILKIEIIINIFQYQLLEKKNRIERQKITAIHSVKYGCITVLLCENSENENIILD